MSTYQCFDLLEFISTCQNPNIAAAMASSVAFRLDVLLQTHARGIFKSVRNTEQQKLSTDERTRDKLAEIEAAFAEIAFAEETFRECGPEHDGAVRSIQELMKMRDEINELAMKLTSLTVDWQGNPRVFTANDLDDLFLRRPELKITTQERQRMHLVAKTIAEQSGMDSDSVQQVVAADEQRRKDELERMATTLENQAPVVRIFFDLACRVELDDVAEGFCNVAKSTQRTLIESSIAAVERELDRAKSDRSMTSIEFAQTMTAALNTQKTLSAALRSPRLIAA